MMDILTPIVCSWMILTVLTELKVTIYMYNSLDKWFTLQRITAYLTCWKCTTFWTSIVLGNGFVISCLAAFIAFTLEVIIEKIQE